MKIIATVAYCGSAVLGGDVVRRSVIIDLGENLPPILRDYLNAKDRCRGKENCYTYQDLSFSILDEQADTNFECSCSNPEWPLGNCLNCGGLPQTDAREHG